MSSEPTMKREVLELSQRLGVVSREDVRAAELPDEYLPVLAKEGELEQLSLGVYMAASHEPGEHLELAVVAKRAARAVFFGITALQFHELTTQLTPNVQIAIERGSWSPKIEWPSVDVFHLSGAAFSAGIETHCVEETVDIRVYSVAKTVADLFKFRGRFGIDVAIEALRAGWREKRFTMDELYEYARVCRVQSVIRPYTEMLK